MQDSLDRIPLRGGEAVRMALPAFKKKSDVSRAASTASSAGMCVLVDVIVLNRL